MAKNWMAGNVLSQLNRDSEKRDAILVVRSRESGAIEQDAYVAMLPESIAKVRISENQIKDPTKKPRRRL